MASKRWLSLASATVKVSEAGSFPNADGRHFAFGGADVQAPWVHVLPLVIDRSSRSGEAQEFGGFARGE